MATGNNRDQHQDETFDADFKEDFNQGMLRMLSQGSSNDVRIILSDGEITANQDVLAAQCEYFAANFRWKERTKDSSDNIDNTDCSKDVMERIIKYLFTGSIKYKDLGLMQLLELLNQVRKMLLRGNLQDVINSYIREDVLSVSTLKNTATTQPHALRSLLIDFFRGLQYVDKYAIDDVKLCILARIYLMLPLIAERDDAISAFAELPCHLVKEFFSLFPRLIKNRPPKFYNSAQFRCFLAWYNQNKDVCQEDKKEILGTIDLDSLPAADLFKLVKPSGLFPDDEVDKRIVECLRERDEMKKNLTAN